MAIKMEGVQCKDEKYVDDTDKASKSWKMYTSDIICGGVGKVDKYPTCWAWGDSSASNIIVSRCRMAQADSVFMLSLIHI